MILMLNLTVSNMAMLNITVSNMAMCLFILLSSLSVDTLQNIFGSSDYTRCGVCSFGIFNICLPLLVVYHSALSHQTGPVSSEFEKNPLPIKLHHIARLLVEYCLART